MNTVQCALVSIALIASAQFAAADIADPLVSPPPGALVRAEASQFSPEGWQVVTGEAQIKWDLGQPYRKGTVEFEIRGPLAQEPKRILFAAWNEEAAKDGDRKTQAFLQVRLIDGGMMLRLTHRAGGRSFEKSSGSLPWPAPETWVKIKANWDTTGGDCVLWRDGVELHRGRFNQPFTGLRWLFLGRDNYMQGYTAVSGTTYRKFRVSELSP